MSRIPRSVLLPVLLLAAPALGGCAKSPASSPGRVNVLMLVMDTTRADRLSVDGYSRPTTPSLEAFAKDAVTFRDAWSPAGWTGPAHASIFTGFRPVHHGYLLGNLSMLPDRATTLAEILAARGYRTACFTNNAIVSPDFGLAQGFSTFESVATRKKPEKSSAWAHERAFEAAEAARREGKPFFVFVNDMEAHLPYDPPPTYARRFVPADTPEERMAWGTRFDFAEGVEVLFGARRLSPAETGILSDLYDADLLWLDDEIGTLLKRFRRAGYLDDTLVVLLADHGEHLGEHGLCDHKQSLYRPICQVPLVLRLPGKFDGGRQVRDPVRLEDVMPTVLTVCGVAVPEGLDGRSLTASLPGRIARAEEGPPNAGMLKSVQGLLRPDQIERMNYSVRSVYDGRWHFLRWSTGREELYDLKSDFEERHDLAAARPDEVRRLTPMLDE